MIDYRTRSWLSLMVQVRGTVLPRVALRTFLVGSIGAAVMYLREHGHSYTIPVTMHTIVGATLGLLLVFRTNTSYDRFWEGRKLVGSMVNGCRDLARQSSIYITSTRGRADASRYIRALYATIRRYLRREREWPELEELLTEEELAELAETRGPPLLVARWLTKVLDREADGGNLPEMRLHLMDHNITRMIDHWGGAERILATPVPFAYAHHIKTFLTLWVFTVPLALSHTMGWFTPFGAAVIAFGLFGIDEIGVEIEDPFGYDANDLPLDAIGDTINKDVDEATAQRDE